MMKTLEVSGDRREVMRQLHIWGRQEFTEEGQAVGRALWCAAEHLAEACVTGRETPIAASFSFDQEAGTFTMQVNPETREERQSEPTNESSKEG